MLRSGVSQLGRAGGALTFTSTSLYTRTYHATQASLRKETVAECNDQVKEKSKTDSDPLLKMYNHDRVDVVLKDLGTFEDPIFRELLNEPQSEDENDYESFGRVQAVVNDKGESLFDADDNETFSKLPDTVTVKDPKPVLRKAMLERSRLLRLGDDDATTDSMVFDVPSIEAQIMYADLDRHKRPDMSFVSQANVDEFARVSKDSLIPWALPPVNHVVRFSYRKHISAAQATHKADRKVILEVRASDLPLCEKGVKTMAALVGNRYQSNRGVLKLASNLFEERAQNEEYLLKLLADIVQEASKSSTQMLVD